MLSRVALACLFCFWLSAQQPQTAPAKPPALDRQPSRFRAQVTEVIVPVTVTDDKDRFVSNLEQSDFRIFDEEQEQKIIYFSREQKQPVVVGFLLDLSNSSRLHWAKFQEAAKELVWMLLPGDPRFSGYLITYGNEAELAVDTTTDADKITQKIEKLKPGGGSAFFDAIYMACTRRSLVHGEPIEPRRILVVIGDGHDSASKHNLEEALEIAQRNLVTIHGASTVAFGFSSEGEQNLKRLCEETGGRLEYPLGETRLYKDVAGHLSNPSDEGNYAYKVGTGAYAAAISKAIYGSIAAISGEITTQYILRYIPNVTDTGNQYRHIRVEVSLPNVTVRARKGYYPYSP
jgi:VWFA-related protein